MKGTFCALLVIFAGGCASAPPALVDQLSAPDLVMPDEACFREWDPIMEEWFARQGGMSGSTASIRKAISGDSSSRFSRLVQMVWAAQNSLDSDASEVPQEKIYEIFSDAVARELKTDVSADCTSIIWIKPLLVETPGAFVSGAKSHLLAEAPPSARVDDRAFSNWLTRAIMQRGSD